MKILYVEDEIPHVILTERTLEENFPNQFELLHAETISAALSLLDSTPGIDLILTDLRLPDGSGLDLLNKVNARTDPPAVVLVTGQGDQENAVAALKAGAADYLVKQSDYLLRLPVAINNAIAHNRLLREKAALREAEIKYQSLVEQTPAVVFLDAADELESPIYVSPRIEILTGYTPEEWVADAGLWKKIIHPDDIERINEAFRYSQRKETPFIEEYRIIHRKGSVVWVKENTALVRGADGTPLYWQGIFLDITQEMSSKATIRESEERFRRIFHASPIATCVVTFSEGRFIDANPAFQNLTGIPLENLLGQTSIELGFWKKVEERNEFIQHMISSGSMQGIETEFFNVPNGPKDTLAYYELIELAGQTCLLAMFYDITQEKKTREALRTERDFALQVLNNMGQGLTVTTQDSVFEYVNPAFANMIGYVQEEIAGKTLSEFSPDSEKHSLENERIKRQEGIASTFESNLIHHDGYLIPVIITGVPRRINNIVSGTIAVVTDLTAIKTAEASLARQVKELTILHTAAEAEITDSENDVIEKITNIIGTIYSEVCGILLLNEKGDILSPHPSYLGADVSNWMDGYSITQGITGKVILTGRPVRCEDVVLEPDYIEIASAIRSELCVPIRVNERVIGVINVESKKHNAFDDSDERFLTTIAGGLGTAIERLRLFNEEERRTRELVSLYQGTKSLAQSFDPQVIARNLISVLSEMLEFELASVHLLESQGRFLIPLTNSQRGINPDALESDSNSWIDQNRELGKGVIGWVAQQGIPLRSGNIPRDPRYISAIKGVQSELCVPMFARGKVIGTINLETRVADAYSERDENLLTALANSAAIALENARLYNETQRRLRELEIINQISASVRMAPSLDEILPVLLNKTLELLNTPHGSIWLYDHSKDMLTQRIAQGADGKLKHSTLKPTDGIVGQTFRTGTNYLSREIKTDPLLFTENRDSFPAGLGGIYIPIQSTAGPVGVLVMLIDSTRIVTPDELHLLSILAEITGNAIHRAELFDQSQEQIRRLTTLRDIDSAIASSTDLRVTLNILTDQTRKHLHVDAVDIMLYRPELQSLTHLCSAGFNTPSSTTRSTIRVGEGLAGQVVMKGRTDHIVDLKNSSEAKREPLLLHEGFVTYIGVPLVVKGQIKGVFEVFQRSTLAPNAEWMQFLQTLAGQAAIAIDNSHLFDNLQRSNQELTQAYDTTLEGWARALELRDRETEGHTRRVTDLTLRLARSMGIYDEELVNIYRGVLLHDIGKMGVPDQILKKTGPLTAAEWQEMRLHPQYAFDLLSPITYLHSALDIPYCHHEHWDGSGYPRGLKGDQIPLSARIFSVVDIWDALLSDRPYRKAWSRDKVLEYIKEISGTVLDPRVAEAFLTLIAQDDSKTENR